MSNAKNPYTDPKMREYFSTLPIFVQESIAQSGTKFESLKQLKTFAENLNQQN